jgi:hypothetical protein
MNSRKLSMTSTCFDELKQRPKERLSHTAKRLLVAHLSKSVPTSDGIYSDQSMDNPTRKGGEKRP